MDSSSHDNAIIYRVLDKKQFYSRASFSSKALLTGIPGSVGIADGFVFVLFKNRHYTIYLTYEDNIWIDAQEIPFLEALGLHLFMAQNCHYIEFMPDNCIGSTGIAWYISSGISRGAMSFHYGHFLTDYIPSLFWLKTQSTLKIPVLAPLPQKYTSPLLSLSSLLDILYDTSLLTRLHETYSTPSDYRRSIDVKKKLFIFDPYPSLDYHSQRNTLIKSFLASTPLNIRRCEYSNTCYSQYGKVVYFYRSVGNYSQRLNNQGEVLGTILRCGGSCVEPSELTIDQSIDLLRGCTHCLVDAGSAAYLPLMFARWLRVAMIVPSRLVGNKLVYPGDLDDFSYFLHFVTIIPALLAHDDASQLTWNSRGRANTELIRSFLAKD